MMVRKLSASEEEHELTSTSLMRTHFVLPRIYVVLVAQEIRNLPPGFSQLAPTGPLD
jgi:hypothetical protein